MKKKFSLYDLYKPKPSDNSVRRHTFSFEAKKPDEFEKALQDEVLKIDPGLFSVENKVSDFGRLTSFLQYGPELHGINDLSMVTAHLIGGPIYRRSMQNPEGSRLDQMMDYVVPREEVVKQRAALMYNDMNIGAVMYPHHYR